MKGIALAIAGAFRDLVSGRRRDAISSTLRFGLGLLEAPYAQAMRLRNRRYDLRQARIHSVDVPVICVGNVTLGGTGKTPMVEYLAKWYCGHDIRVVIVSRGYRSARGRGNDEAKELSEKLPQVPHIQNPDRVAAARHAVEHHGAELILLDDGFQHRRLARQLDIVLIDALAPLGFGRVFPRGLLREPVSGLSRADVVALTRADLVSVQRRREIRQQVGKYAPQAHWIEVAHVPTALQTHDGVPSAASELNGKRIAAFCGIGNPDGFRRTLDACGAEVVDLREYPDHHHFTSHDLESLSDWVSVTQPELVVCTHKDLVKVQCDRLATVPLRALLVELQIITGDTEFKEILKRSSTARQVPRAPSDLVSDAGSWLANGRGHPRPEASGE